MRCLFVVLSLLVLPILPVSAQDWTPVDLGTTVTLRAIGQGDFPVRYLVGDEGYVSLSDVTFAVWTPIDVGTSADLTTVIHPDSGQVWIGGRGGVVRVLDAGGEWDARDVPDTAQDYVLFARDNGEVLAAGSGGSIWKTTDAGLSWTLQDSGTATTLHAGIGAAGGDYVVGDGGLILKSTDEGATWAPLPSGTTENLYAIELAGFQGSWLAAVGANGTILTSDDDGATWILRVSGTTATLRALVRRGESFGSHLAFGDGGTVLRSASGFTSSCSLATGVTTDFYTGLMQTDVTIYLAAGEDGVLLRTELTGGPCVTVANEPEATAGFALSAVSPNPARGTATLTLRAAREQRVTAEVFDLLGRRVTTLFEGPATTAPLALTLDARRLRTGFYIVRVRGEHFIAARRVTVVR